MKLVIGLIMICLMVCSVNAWTIVDKENRVSGTVDFYGDGHGILNVTSGPVINFSWYQNNDAIRANYLFYWIDVYYNANTDELYSLQIPNVTLVR